MNPAFLSPDGALFWLLLLLVAVIVFYTYMEYRWTRRVSEARRDLDERRAEREAAENLRVSRTVQGSPVKPPIRVDGRW